MYIHGQFYIPDRMMEGIYRYMEEGCLPGRFLTAVIENNLMNACAWADDENVQNIPAYAAYLYNECPSASHGSKKKMQDWIKMKTKKVETKICQHVYQKNSTIPACILCGKIKEE